MSIRPGLFLLLLTVLQVHARYKNVEPEFIDNVIRSESAVVSSSSRIVSGWEAQEGQFPHHVSLRIVSAGGSMGRCGGAIVSEEWVITAAQCTAGRASVIVRAGVLSISATNPENIFTTTEWYNYPSFNDLRPTVVQPNDISLVKLPRPVVYSRLVKAIRIQSRADAYRNYDGEQVYVTGHGRTSTSDSTSDLLKWVYLRAISNDACVESANSGTVDDTIICAQFYNNTAQSPCQADYGGPLVHVGSDGVPTLIGIFVFTISPNNACHQGLPTGFTRPGPYLSWFREITGINFDEESNDDATSPPDGEEPDDSPPESEDEEPEDPEESPPEGGDHEPEDPDDSPPEGEDGEPEDPDDSPPEDGDEDPEDPESNEDSAMGLLKRLQVNVKVNVRFDKYNVPKNGGMAVDNYRN